MVDESYISPVKPFGQPQRKLLPTALHSPLFRHGVGTQGETAVSQCIPVYCSGQLQEKPVGNKYGKNLLNTYNGKNTHQFYHMFSHIHFQKMYMHITLH